MQPGLVDVRVIVTGDEGFQHGEHLLLGLLKESSPPLISISDSVWEGCCWSMKGSTVILMGSPFHSR